MLHYVKRGHCMELIQNKKALAAAFVVPRIDNSPAHTIKVCTAPAGFVSYQHSTLTPYALKTLRVSNTPVALSFFRYKKTRLFRAGFLSLETAVMRRNV